MKSTKIQIMIQYQHNQKMNQVTFKIRIAVNKFTIISIVAH